MEDLFHSLSLLQVIAEPTNFTPHCNPSCIDLVLTDQPNLVLDSGVRPSPDAKCHHQIVHCKINVKTPSPPTRERRVWRYYDANVDAIQRSLRSFPWEEQFRLHNDVNSQVKIFNNTILNVMSNFVPNSTKRFSPRDSPWINKQLTTKLRKKNRLYRNYKKHGYKDEDKERLNAFREECQSDIEQAKSDYLTRLGNKLKNPLTPQKVYWKIVNKVMNKCKSSRIPPLIVNNDFVTCCREKAKLFNDFFCNQCRLIQNCSILPPFHYITHKRISSIPIQSDKILFLIRGINSK